MTEEEARPENTQPKASQPEAKTESHKSLTDKISNILTDTFSLKQTKEQKTMANNEETRAENTQSSFLFNQLSAKFPAPPPTPPTPDDAKAQFIGIKLIQIGPFPEWCLPKVNDKAKASDPKIDDSALTHGCQSDPVIL
jgi:hypothetical protein